MLDDPGLDTAALHAALRDAYGIEATSRRFVRSHDDHAASYVVETVGDAVFVKVRWNEFDEVALEVAAVLSDVVGSSHVLAPLRAGSGRPWTPMGAASLTVHPFVPGRSAMAGMDPDRWRTFGATLRAVHDSGLERRFADGLPVDQFDLACAPTVRRTLEGPTPRIDSAAARRFAELLGALAPVIATMLERAEGLGLELRSRAFERVVCHADIHAANILVADDGRILLVDWDGPVLAPRERDLLFVIGSRIARDVEPREEAWFFEGYGDIAVDPEAIVFYRYERLLEDVAAYASSVLGDPSLSEGTRASDTDLVASFFAAGGIADGIEIVHH